MPYIKKHRDKLKPTSEFVPQTAGDLNYQITELIGKYVDTHGWNYQTSAEIEGVLSHIQKELYRRITKKYELIKIMENGDVDWLNDLETELEQNLMTLEYGILNHKVFTKGNEKNE